MTVIAESKLTNEILKKRYHNTFDLVNKAILLARHMIESGKDLTEGPNTKNQATRVLNELDEQDAAGR